MNKLATVLIALTLPFTFGTACGSDDDSADTTSTSASTTESSAPSTDGSTTGDAAFPTADFCAAQAELAAAQDGAQRNTAIGEMQDALPDDAPPAVEEALDNLLTGDLAPEAYTAAEQTLADACA